MFIFYVFLRTIVYVIESRMINTGQKVLLFPKRNIFFLIIKNRCFKFSNDHNDMGKENWVVSFERPWCIEIQWWVRCFCKSGHTIKTSAVCLHIVQATEANYQNQNKQLMFNNVWWTKIKVSSWKYFLKKGASCRLSEKWFQIVILKN